MSAQSDEEREWIGMQFNLDSLAPSVRDAVWAAAIPHWFDKAFLDSMLGKPLRNEEFESLTSLSYVEKFDRGLGSEGYAIEAGFNVHERTRNLLLDKLWKNEPEKYRELNRRAAEYCAKKDQKNPIWRIETIYHRLVADDEWAVNVFSNQFVEWHNKYFDYGKIEALARPILEEVNTGRLKGNATALLYVFQGILDTLYARYPNAKKHFKLGLQQEHTGNIIKAMCMFRLGNVHRILAEYDQACQQYEQALKICQENNCRLGEANCILEMGNVHRILAEYEQACNRYEDALRIFQKAGSSFGEANCNLGLGQYYKAMNQSELAIKTLEDAAQHYRNIGLKREEDICLNLIEKIKGEISKSES